MTVTGFMSYFLFYLYISVGNSEKRMLMQTEPDITGDIAQMKVDINQLKSENSLLMTEVTRMRTENADLKATVDSLKCQASDF
jgi:FtsZ-binding cell division protein ZapB